MDRRIRVKCPECAASIELRVDQQELMDVTCPRCQHAFTAIVPPQIVEVEPIEVIEPVVEQPVVRKTRVVEPAPASRPKRVRQLPQRTAQPVDPYSQNGWQTPHYQPLPQHSAPPISAGTHLKAILIAGGSVLGVGMLVMFGIMISSAVSKFEWSPSDEDATASSSTSSSSSSPSSLDSTDSQFAGSTSSTASSIASSPSASMASSTAPTSSSTNPSVGFDSSRMPEASSNVTSSMPGASSNPSMGDVAEKVIPLANQIAQATMDSDNEFVLDRTHPKLIELAGGRKKLLEQMNKALAPLKQQNITIASFTVSNSVTVRQVDRKIFAVLPTTLDLNYQGRIMRTDSFLLAVSEDAGQSFSFISGSEATKNRDMLKRIIPDLPNDLAFPPPATPRQISP